MAIYDKGGDTSRVGKEINGGIHCNLSSINAFLDEFLFHRKTDLKMF